LAEQHARDAGYTPESREWWAEVMTFEIQIEIDLEILSLMFAGPVRVPPLPGAVDFHTKKRRRYWKKVMVPMPGEMRRVERLVSEQWVEVRMIDLKAGDRFRMFEPEGAPVADGKGRTVFRTTGDAYLNPDGVATVTVEE